MRTHLSLLALGLTAMLASCGPSSTGSSPAAGSPSLAIRTADKKPLTSDTYLAAGSSLIITASDPSGKITDVRYQLNNGALTSLSPAGSMPIILPSSLGSGSHSFYVEAKSDRGGQVSTSATLKIDATAPVFAAATLNNSGITDGMSYNATTGSASLSVTATDSRGGGDSSTSPVTVTVYVGETAIKTGTNSVTADLGSLTGTNAVRIVARDSVGNVATRVFSVIVTAPGQTVPQNPAPVLVLNNAGAEPYSNIVSVTASGGFPAGSAVKSLSLEIVDSSGIVDNTTYRAVQPTQTFSVDTTKFPDGPLTMRVVAITQDNLTGTSAPTTVQIQNLVAPTFQIVAPTSGSSVGNTLQASVQLTKSNTPFTINGNSVTLKVLDYRGATVGTPKTVTFTQPNPGVYVATASFDMSGTLTPNNIYTLVASTDVVLESSPPTTRTLEERSQFTTQITNNKPPALIIQMPAYADGGPTSGIPIINRKTGVLVQVSDDNEISEIQVQMTCNQSVTPSCGNQGSYAFNIPVRAAGMVFRVFQIGSILDGIPYVADGQYILRFTVSDGQNTNLQEIVVNVDRSKTLAIGNVQVATRPHYISGQPNPIAAAWGLGSFSRSTICASTDGEDCTPQTFAEIFTPTVFANNMRVMTLYFANVEGTVAGVNPSDVVISPYQSPSTWVYEQRGFKDAGSYRVDFIIEDMTTGIVEYRTGPTVTVVKN